MPSTAKSVHRTEVARPPRFLDAKSVVRRAQEKPAEKPVASAAPRRKPRANGASSMSDQERRGLVEVAAYYIAERRGFPGCGQLEDWLEAEREVDRLLREGSLHI